MTMGKGSKKDRIFWGDIGQVMAKQSEIPLKIP